MLIDLDRFRSVNDTLGHLAGDRLLLQIADRLRLALPRGAEAARLGGDEFAVLLPVADSTTRAQRVARDLVADLGSPLDLDGLTLVLEASAGRRRLPRPRARRRGAAAPGGRGDVPGQAGPHAASRCTSPSATPTPPTGSACSATCAGRWTRGDVELHYQPKVRFDGQVAGLEALVRWVHPERGQGAAGRVHRHRRVVRADAAPHRVRPGDRARARSRAGARRA